MWKVKRIYFFNRVLDNGVVYAFFWEFGIAMLHWRLVQREKLYFDIEVCTVEQKSCLKDESCMRVSPSGQIFVPRKI